MEKNVKEYYMPCFHPVFAYKALNRKTENGKAFIAFQRCEVSDGPFEEIKLPCGQCLGCRIDRSKSWALRCVHESQLHDENCFITLTFNDEYINESGSLVKADFQKFMKRLRKHFPEKKIRYFHCGEYGSQLSRPHHHAAIFGLMFHDKKLWSVRDGIRLYRSPTLEKLWPYGFSTIGDVTYDSAAYIARYCMKKVNGKKSTIHYMRVDEETGEVHKLQPEYITMSRRPGIAREWIEKNFSDVYPKDYTTHQGRKFKPPKYYDKIYDVNYPESFVKIKKIRLQNMKNASNNNTPERLKVREGVFSASIKRFKRVFEKGDLL